MDSGNRGLSCRALLARIQQTSEIEPADGFNSLKAAQVAQSGMRYLLRSKP
jgi:hypothetical protein